MGILRFDLENSFPRSQPRLILKVIDEQINQLICTALVRANGTMSSKDIGDFSLDLQISRSRSLPNSWKIWSVNKLSISRVIVARTDSKYGIKTYIGTYLFYLRLALNVKNTIKQSSVWCAYFSTKILHIYNECLPNNPKNYFALYKRHLE